MAHLEPESNGEGGYLVPVLAICKEGEVVRRLNGAGRLRCFLAADRAREHADDDKCTIRKVLRSSEQNYRTHLEHKNQDATVYSGNNGNNASHQQTTVKGDTSPPLYGFIPLRELVLDISFYACRGIDSFSLTNLNIRIGYSYHSEFDLTILLGRCPLLEHFSAEMHGIP